MLEKLTCDTCHETYKGKFRMTNVGRVECVDCDNKEYLPTTFDVAKVTTPGKIKNPTTSTVMHNYYLGMLKREIHELYPNLSKYPVGEVPDVDIKMIYYQNNNIKLVLRYYNEVITCIRYLEDGEKEYREHCIEVIKRLLVLRERILLPEEEQEYMEYSESTVWKNFVIYNEIMS